MTKTTSLTRFADQFREPHPQHAWDAGKRAWQDHAIVCISLEEAEKRLGWSTARQLRNIGEQAFGKRFSGSKN